MDKSLSVRYEVFTALKVHVKIFWVVTPCHGVTIQKTLMGKSLIALAFFRCSQFW